MSALVLLVLATPVAAQQARYTLPPHDTLRYHELTDTRSELRPPLAPVTITTRHDATIAVVAVRGDTAQAWYEELTFRATGPQGDASLATDGALRQPFRIVVTRTGRVTTVAAPTFPADLAAQTDLTREFEDFFISLPRSALRANVAWTDTLHTASSAGAQDSFQLRHIRRYRAVRDTAFDGQVGMVIAVEQEMVFEFSSPLKNAPVTVHTRLEGREEGTAVFDRRAGRLLLRDRRGHLTGEQVLRGEGRTLIVPMTYEYTSSLRLR